MIMGKILGIGGAAISLDLLSQIIEEGIATVNAGKVEKKMEWLPLSGFKYDATQHVMAE
jgi:hypothetical protein